MNRTIVSITARPLSRAFACGLTAVLLGAATSVVLADEPTVTPQRPSLSTSVWTTPHGYFELEAGASFSERAGALPLFGKYGLTDALELEVGTDAVRWVDGPGEGETSIGDLLMGGRWRPSAETARIQLAFAGLVKLPTAGDDAGSGEIDVTLIGIASVPLENGLGLDLNLVWTALGQDADGTLGQGQAIATLGIPLGGRWSSFVETAYQRTAGHQDGGFFDAGLAYSATPRAVFDVAVGVGWSEGYPDWSATVGWTVLFGADH